MKAFWKHAASIFFSLIGLALIMAVWLAGNPEYGSITILLQAVGVKGLILLCVTALVISMAFAVTGKNARPSLQAASATALVIAILPLVCFMLVLFAKYMQHAN